jgi:4-diphosphocytidyl-2-C-methyl-D-erythritol kinase
MQSIRVPAFAKVNLRLDVLNRSEDGYHQLRTVFQSLTLHDTLFLTRTKEPHIELSVTGNASLAAAAPQENLVWRAIAAMKRELKLREGVRVQVQKRIPVGRGLGGGSSDAAAAMIGLLRLTGHHIPLERLMAMGAELGADVPFFLFGGRALGTNRGDEIYPQRDLPPVSVLVVSPSNISVSTRDAYQWIDARLTKPQPISRLWGFCALCWSTQVAGLSNDFEQAVFPRYPRLRSIKRELLERGAAEASLAGSGSAVFGIFRDPAQARRAARQFPEDQVFLCRTISQKAYSRALWGPLGHEGRVSKRRRH